MNSDPFQNGDIVTTRSMKDVLIWTKESGDSRLFLPPIQRSLVWRNSQIINYWDSLLRGYPAGLMMVHRPKAGAPQARTSDGNTCEIRDGDFQLFDGQQRLTAILLGLGEGQLKNRLRFWVDIGSEAPANGALRFTLRITSTGQPFGYKADEPNQKYQLQKRRDKVTDWMKRTGNDRFESKKVFEEARADDLIDAVFAIPLPDVVCLLQEHEVTGAVGTLQASYPAIPADNLEIFLNALSTALLTPVLFQLIDRAVIYHEDEYIRFFGRLGQGGTPLTNDELTYSIIKHHFPEVHDRMKEITHGPAGRVAGEVNLVLAALRVAKVIAPWNDSREWEIFGRPYPGFISRLRDTELSGVESEFRRMIPDVPGGRLGDLLKSIRHRLEYDAQVNPYGLPVILLARLPHQLVDVLLLMESCRPTQNKRDPFFPAFVLYWLLFVSNGDKAANMIFRKFYRKESDWEPNGDKELIRTFEEEGISRRLVSMRRLEEARIEIQSGTFQLRAWGERFAALDDQKAHPVGDALRMLSTNPELIRCALLWLQRSYMAETFPSYDPTSIHDEDLPIDLDHLIPSSKFGGDWRTQKTLLIFEDANDNFYWHRWTVGNSLGNYRWLDSSDNRSRRAGLIDEADAERDFIDDVPNWNHLIATRIWTEDHVAGFQRMIDLRTIEIYKRLMTKGGLEMFVTEL